MSKSTDQLVRIAAGGGIRLEASSKSTDQLVRIAAAMANTIQSNKATLALYGIDSKSTDQLVKIAAAGKGCVVFEL